MQMISVNIEASETWRYQYTIKFKRDFIFPSQKIISSKINSGLWKSFAITKRRSLSTSIHTNNQDHGGFPDGTAEM